MAINHDDAAARVSKIFERLEGAPLAPVPIGPSRNAPKREAIVDPAPVPARPNTFAQSRGMVAGIACRAARML